MHFMNNLIHKIGIGTSSYGSIISKNSSLKILNILSDHGLRYIDTAPSYGYGQSEKIISNLIKKDRESYFLSTKFGIQPSNIKHFNILFPLFRKIYSIPGIKKKTNLVTIPNQKTLTLEEVSRSINSSLINLKTTYLDQILIHNNAEYYLNNNMYIDFLNELKHKEIIKKVGATTHELNSNLIELINKNISCIDTLQIPYNLRWFKSKIPVNYFSIFSDTKPNENELINTLKSINGFYIIMFKNPQNIKSNLKIFLN